MLASRPYARLSGNGAMWREEKLTMQPAPPFWPHSANRSMMTGPDGCAPCTRHGCIYKWSPLGVRAAKSAIFNFAPRTSLLIEWTD
eukprot:1134120-Pelagomonas_calceolata.AAC.1